MFEDFLFYRWNKTILRVINWLLGAVFLGFLAYKFKVYNTIEYPLSHHKDYRIDGTFFPYVFFLILFYFYFLFTEWLIKKITTYRVNQTQFLQVLQEKKLVVEGQEYQVEKIDKLKISFYPQTVNFRGILIIPQEGSYLKLDFSANTSLDYYNQQLFSYLQGVSQQIGKKNFSLIWIFFHSTLLIFFFGYLFINTPLIVEEAKRRRQQSEISKIPPSSQEEIWLLRLENEPFPSHIEKTIRKEIHKLKRMHPWSGNRDVQEKFIEDLMSLPWWQTSKENKDLAAARAELDRSHSGLEKIKERIIEHLAGQQKSDQRAPVICLVGPPGTGKTSLGQSIARATGRKFAKISVGGVSDEGEIRGHRKTYIAATFGKILQGIKKAGTINALLLIDEIDKISKVTGFHGNPSAALLEVLDPEQNEKFNDHYLGQEIPYDLSKIMFICTANELEDIPGPLQDRMEIIHLPPYTTLDKIQIAKNHLIPKILAESNLEEDQLTFTDEAIEEIIRFYAYSGSSRAPERVFRRFASKFAKKQIEENLENEEIDLAKVKQYLGARIVELEAIDYDETGMINGLAYNPAVGGVILPIEVNCLPGKGDLKLTGNLGETMQESAQAALSYIRANHRHFGLDNYLFKENDICIHVPRGGVPKDGPSAGIALTTAILSALKRKVIPYSITMTGEITSKGKISEIGGLREKLTAAYEHKLKTVFIPQENKRHLEDIPSRVKDKLEIIPVNNYLQVWDKLKLA